MELSLKHLNQKLYDDNFCFAKKIIRTGNYLLLTGHRICYYLMARIMALQQTIDKKRMFSSILVILSSF